jgi:hypothetical protein
MPLQQEHRNGNTIKSTNTSDDERAAERVWIQAREQARRELAASLRRRGRTK